MQRKTIYMESTKRDPEDTISEIQKVLRNYGVRNVMLDYDDHGEVSGMMFRIQLEEMDDLISIVLPANHLPLLEMANKGETKYLKQGDETQAKRIAWRQILRWVEAQLALVDLKMVKIQEVFLPYMAVDQLGTTLYQALESKGMNFDKLLPPHEGTS